SPDCAGNYRRGNGKYLVFEADESDKSLLVYRADYVLILNLGTDHYPKPELIDVFANFAAGAGKGVILGREVNDLIRNRLPEKLPVTVFGPEVGEISLPICGRHNVFNAAAVLAALRVFGYAAGQTRRATEKFCGVWRRFDYLGKTATGAAVYDDYAHNPEKIASCIRTAQEIAAGKMLAVFQPHGFGPFGFMRETLLKELEETLRPQDEFLLLPPFYAGGTSSFKPTAEEVAAAYRQNGTKKYSCFGTRSELTEYLRENAYSGDIILIMGARDNSLSDYARSLVSRFTKNLDNARAILTVSDAPGAARRCDSIFGRPRRG
ncbi:MAG: cyanophycin synthetase, partial [Victivallaceae bacterium]|nr:cyanophycin synthetase [Victivallaceae bacterium]